MAAIRKLETEETKTEETTPVQVPIPDLHHLCPVHHTYFPEEDALRPLEGWSYNPVTLEPLRTYCRKCDAAHKSFYAAKKKATSGPLAIERVQELLEIKRKELSNCAGRDDPQVGYIKAYIVYLESQLTMLREHEKGS